MEEQFLPYEESAAFKEIGFDEPVFAVYGYTPENQDSNPPDKLALIHEIIKHEGNYLSPVDLINSRVGDDVAAPTWSQALDFLRKNFGLKVDVEQGENPSNFYPIVSEVDKKIFHSHKHNPGQWYDTYEKARLASIVLAIEIAKKQR